MNGLRFEYHDLIPGASALLLQILYKETFLL